MKPNILLLLCASLLLAVTAIAQQPASDKEKMVDALIKSGYLRREGNHLIFKAQKASDTARIKMMYGALFNNTQYTIGFDIDGKYFDSRKTQKNQDIQSILTTTKPQPKGTKNTDNQITVNGNTAALPTSSLRRMEYLQNPDFEMGIAVPHWNKEGEAFKEPYETTGQLTWKDMQVVTVGGDYWKDLDFHRGNHARNWISSLKPMMGGNWELRRQNGSGATGTLTSGPFKIYPAQKYLSFLVGGGKDENNLKVELLKVQVRPRISGDISIQSQQLPGTPRRPVQTGADTIFVAVPGVSAVTGHNNEQFRRAWWDLTRIDTAGYYVIRITDRSTDNTGWGFINVDDFRFLPKSPLQYTGEDSLRVLRVTIKDFVSNATQQVYIDYFTPLYGAADTHTHLMSHLSMGRKLMYGAPDIGSIVPAGTLVRGFDAIKKECNETDIRATTVEEALGNCNAAHGGWGVDNDCGNYLRAMLINLAFDGEYVHRVPFESNMHGDHPHAGYPNFLHWPHQSSMSHQQMYVDWIKRAYEGGLRVLVTLAVNNELLGNMVSGDPPYDDKSTADLQLDEIRSFVQRHNDFMELALTTADMRRIIQSGKMAVIMGIEVDNIGSFNYAGNIANETTVRAEIRRLYNKGVRYIFPIHLTDNKFGGMAVYSVLFGFSNKFANTRPSPIGQPLPPGNMLTVRTASDPLVKYRLTLLHDDLPAGTTAGLTVVAKPILDFIGELHFPPLFDLFNCPEAKVKCIPQFKIITSLLSEPGWDAYNAVSGGHVNVKGLSTLGKFAVREMMKLGMIIDIDHMSERSVDDAFNIAEQYNYPLVSGHNGLREGYFEKSDHKVNENNRSRTQLERLRNLNGVFGLGIGESSAEAYFRNFRRAMPMMGNKAITMGSDINGFVVMPHARPGSAVKYFPNTAASAMRKYSFANKTWDYNTDGVAHIGLYPDYFQDLKNLGMTQRERQVFFSAADYLVNMWQQCERNKVNVR